MSSIRVSEKHGINPCVSVCFWCGKPKNEIMLLGKLPGDKEAPREAAFDCQPCDECAKGMAQGITFMETEDGKTPTGKYVVMKTESAKDLLTNNFQDVDVDKIMELKKLFLDSQIFRLLFSEVTGENK